MCRHLISGNFAQQQVTHHRTGNVGAAICQKRTHRAVNAHHTGAAPKTVKGGDVAEPDYPFPGSFHFVERELAYELDSAVTATIAEIMATLSPTFR